MMNDSICFIEEKLFSMRSVPVIADSEFFQCRQLLSDTRFVLARFNPRQPRQVKVLNLLLPHR